jgi:hypothetical protein
VLACLLKPIRKFAFNCLTNLKEKQLEKLARGFLSKTITFKECPTKEGRPNLNPCTSSKGCLSERL